MNDRLTPFVKICPIHAAILSKSLEPALNVLCEGPRFQADEGRGERPEKAQTLGELVSRALCVVPTDVMKPDGNLDDGLVEVAKGVGCGAPQVFKSLVAVPEEASVELLYGSGERGGWRIGEGVSVGHNANGFQPFEPKDVRSAPLASRWPVWEIRILTHSGLLHKQPNDNRFQLTLTRASS